MCSDTGQEENSGLFRAAAWAAGLLQQPRQVHNRSFSSIQGKDRLYDKEAFYPWHFTACAIRQLRAESGKFISSGWKSLDNCWSPLLFWKSWSTKLVENVTSKTLIKNVSVGNSTSNTQKLTEKRKQTGCLHVHVGTDQWEYCSSLAG